MKAHGVDVLPSSRTGDPTSVADATLDETGAATYRFDLHWNLQRVPIRSGVNHLHTGSIAATEAPGASMVLSTLVEARPWSTISYDPNARPSIMGDPDAVRGHMEAVIALSDVVKASEDDIAWLYPDRTVDEVLEQWHALGATFTLATLGAEGVAFRVPRTWPTRLSSWTPSVPVTHSWPVWCPACSMTASWVAPMPAWPLVWPPPSRSGRRWSALSPRAQ
jgi:fructokinase